MDESTHSFPWRKRSISLFLTLSIGFSLAVGLSCVAVGALTFYLESDEIRSQSYHRLEGLRDEKIGAISHWYGERAADLTILTQRQDLREICAAHELGRPMDVGLGREVLEAVREAYQYQGVFIVDAKAEGFLINTSKDVFSLDDLPIRKKTFERAIRALRVVVSDVIISKVHSKPSLLFAAPVLAPEDGRVLCSVGILEDPRVDFYPQFTQSAYLGETGEILLVNRDRVAQSPLKYRMGSISEYVIDADPARRGAAGETGRAAIDDYRPEPVVAAFGHIPELGWGLVVKQDLSEIDIPVMDLARNILLVSSIVLVLAILLGLLVARRISLPAMRISRSAAAVGAGALNVRAPVSGPTEIRRIATEINRMVETLSGGVRVNTTLAELYAAAGQHGELDGLLSSVLPILMETTRSQLASVYIARGRGGLEQIYTRGVPAGALPPTINLDPPDHLLAEAAAAGCLQHHRGLPADTGLVLSTTAGSAPARSLVGFPLFVGGEVRGVVGVASLYDYRAEDLEIFETLTLNLGQSFEVVMAAERTEALAREVNETNQDLTAANEELQVKSEELQAQTDELRQVAQELDAQRLEVEEADRLKSEFLSNMSHELRTPLNSVLALSQLMLDRGTGVDPETESEYLRVIEKSGHHLLNLINDILDLAKVESGKMEIELSLFRVSDAIRSAAETVIPLAADKGLTVVTEDLSDVSISSDEMRVRQVLLNLLSNALKFTKEGGVRVEARETAGGIRIQIIDSGIGIPPEELAHIFDEFRQVDGGLTRTHEGTGLGLAICRRLTGLLGGSLTVESEVGRGSTFTLQLPLNVAPGQAWNGAPERRNMSPDLELPVDVLPVQPSGSRTALVVEDNEIALLHIRTTLVEHGWTVHSAANGREGLERLMEQVPDVLVLDLMMPEVDGFGLLDSLGSVPGAADLPVLVISAKELTREDRGRLAARKVDQLIRKGSLNRVQLVSAVEGLLRTGRKRGLLRTGRKRTPSMRRMPRLGAGSSGPILVVEDHPGNRLTMRALLEDVGREVVLVEDAAAGISRARDLRPDLVLMDIQLPGMSGIEAVQQMRAIPELADIPVVAVTARAMKGDREELLAAGFDDYLSKPIDREALAAVLSRQLRGER